jgi:nucleoside-diphosphate-sugar epimerase
VKIFITGATGFVGANLVRYFAGLGHEVIASGRCPSPPLLLKKYAAYVPWDLSNGQISIKADMAVHVAGLAADAGKWDAYASANITGSRNFIKSAADCEKLVVISSSSVYSFNNGPATESDAIVTDALPFYGRSKYLAEEEVLKHCGRDQQVLIFRPRAVYGVGDRVLLPKLMSLEKAGVIISPLRKGVKTSLTHISNLQEAIRLFSRLKMDPGAIRLNIADEPQYALASVLSNLFFVYYGRKLPVIPVSPALIRPLVSLNSAYMFHKTLTPMMFDTITNDSVLDISKAKELLQYKPVTDFNAAIGEITDWVHRFGSKSNYLNNLTEAPWSFIEH